MQVLATNSSRLPESFAANTYKDDGCPSSCEIKLGHNRNTPGGGMRSKSASSRPRGAAGKVSWQKNLRNWTSFLAGNVGPQVQLPVCRAEALILEWHSAEGPAGDVARSQFYEVRPSHSPLSGSAAHMLGKGVL